MMSIAKHNIYIYIYNLSTVTIIEYVLYLVSFYLVSFSIAFKLS